MKTTSPYFLQAAGSNRTPVDVITLRFGMANPTQSGWTIAEDVLVRTTYQGQLHEETVAAGVTSISFLADADTDILIFGKVTGITLPSGDYTMSSIRVRSSSLLSINTSYSGSQENYTINKIEVVSSKNISQIGFQTLYLLDSLYVSDCPSLQSIHIDKAPALAHISLKSSPIQTVYLGYLYKVYDIDFLRGLDLLSLTLTNSPFIKSVNASAFPNLETLNISSTKADLVVVSMCTALKTLKVSASEITALDLSHNLSLETLEAAEVQCPIDVSALQSLKALKLNMNNSVIDITSTSSLQSLNIANCQNLENLEISTSSLSTLTLGGNNSLQKFIVPNSLYYQISGTPNAPVLRELRSRAYVAPGATTALKNLINSSNVSNGVAYLNSSDPGYQTVADAATAKGWTIEPLV